MSADLHPLLHFRPAFCVMGDLEGQCLRRACLHFQDPDRCTWVPPAPKAGERQGKSSENYLDAGGSA